ncbi:MAG: NAD-dependent epimerase/dehydratase family protein [Lentisphaeria bacterium]|nr:NAD-dependent epimerase/dehydratase family protein [Lentisphaeria bacterium]
MKTILVTGGAGFIGSHIVERYQGKAHIRILDNFRSGNIKNLAGMEYELIEGDITDRAVVAKAVQGVDYIFHLAAMISVPESMTEIVECNRINSLGTIVVLEEAAKAGVKKLVLSTSAAIYGDNPVCPKVETMFPEPKSPYAITKLDDEYYCNMFAKEGRLSTACLRYFNVFGPRQNPKSAYAAAVPIFITKALQNEDITIFGDGEQTRDFIFVKDIAAANAFMAESEFTGVYNVAYGGRLTINDLAEKIVKILGSKSKIVHLPERAGDVKHSSACVDKLKSTGFKPEFNFDQGLEIAVKAYRDALLSEQNG